ncbi:MAG: phosphomannomutase/phosphoglucomutase, partial [Firmicutes bacterium]|nr:phosphomannomutase/phosphoglucomutase [Bacillota bacterium]
AAVGSDGREIARNRIVGLAAYIASKDHPGTTIVTDSITSTQLHDFIENKLGCRHLRFKRGYKNVISKGQELNREGTDCQLAIETSGHAAMKENYFLDDGAYLATKIVIEAALLKKEGKHIEDLIADLKDPLEAKEVRFKVLAEDFSSYAQGVLDFVEAEAPKIPGWSLEDPNYEGVRVNVPGGWFLLRKSLHDPVMPLNIESDIKGGAEETLAKLKAMLSVFDQLK